MGEGKQAEALCGGDGGGRRAVRGGGNRPARGDRLLRGEGPGAAQPLRRSRLVGPRRGQRPAPPRRGDHHRGRTREGGDRRQPRRSEEHTSELQSLMRISYAVFCLNNKKSKLTKPPKTTTNLRREQ